MRIEAPISAQAPARRRRIEPVRAPSGAAGPDRRPEASVSRTRGAADASAFAAQVLGAILPQPRLVAVGPYAPPARPLRGLMCDLYA